MRDESAYHLCFYIFVSTIVKCKSRCSLHSLLDQVSGFLFILQKFHGTALTRCIALKKEKSSAIYQLRVCLVIVWSLSITCGVAPGTDVSILMLWPKIWGLMKN